MAVIEEQLIGTDLVKCYRTVRLRSLPKGFDLYSKHLYTIATLFSNFNEQPQIFHVLVFITNLLEQLPMDVQYEVHKLVEDFLHFLVCFGFLSQNPLTLPRSTESAKATPSSQIIPVHLSTKQLRVIKTTESKHWAEAVDKELKSTPGNYSKNREEILRPVKMSKIRTVKRHPISPKVRNRGSTKENSTRILVSELPYLKEWFLDYRKVSSKNKICESTMKQYNGNIDQLIDFLTISGHAYLTTDTLLTYVNHLTNKEFPQKTRNPVTGCVEVTNKKYDPNSISTKKSTICAFLRALEAKRGILIEDYDEILSTSKAEKVVKRHHRALTIQEINALVTHVATLPPKDKAEVLIPLWAGTRPEETTDINYNNTIDTAAGVLHVTGKGGKYRKIPILPILMPLLNELVSQCKDKNTYIFSSRQSEHITTKTLNSHIAKLCSRAGIEGKVTAHDLRKTYCTILAKYSKIDVFRLSHNMGHSDLNTTNTYVQDITPSEDISLDLLFKLWSKILYGTEDLQSLVSKIILG